MSATTPYASIHSPRRQDRPDLRFRRHYCRDGPLHARAFDETLAPLGVAVDYASIAGLKTGEAIVGCLRTRVAAKRISICRRWSRKSSGAPRKLTEEQLEPFPAVEAFLVWARSRFRMAAVTSGSRGTMTLALRKLGYEGWFDPIVCAEDVAHAKPVPPPQGARRHAGASRASAGVRRHRIWI
jgi:beta-phosphoglucomutase-like phosphatase (HAD superfamily)